MYIYKFKLTRMQSKPYININIYSHRTKCKHSHPTPCVYPTLSRRTNKKKASFGRGTCLKTRIDRVCISTLSYFKICGHSVLIPAKSDQVNK